MTDWRAEHDAELGLRRTFSARADLLRAALETIADIAEGSRSVNSLPHIARIAREAVVQEKKL